ncbi:MAG: cytochrome-c peroxidase [Planctomycetes bacterium]|nr:cytochrome-c peroxidase [Planctomycetota bacterium]
MKRTNKLAASSTILALAACQGPIERDSAPPDRLTPAASPMPAGETRPAFADTSMLVVPRAPGDDEPVEVLPDIEELSEQTGIEPEPERIELGRRLFHDPRLSRDHTVSCATCHDLRFGGTDRFHRAVGIDGQVGPVNTPTVFNAALSVAQFWDGRAHDLQDQAAGPPEAAGEMDSSFAEIVARIQKDADYVEAFRAAFPDDVDDGDDIDRQLILDAIATFELTLLTPGSAFDRWLDGDEDALDASQRRGYALFKHVGCAECHYGPALGGKAFQKLGLRREFFTDRTVTHTDLGRYNVTGDERDRHTFKVPSLRNVAVTPPYFHDGSIETLEQAVREMADHQLATKLDERDTRDLTAFLRSLTGTYQGRPLMPVTPPATPAEPQTTGGEQAR